MNRNKLLYLSNFIVAATAGLIFLTRDLWLLLLLIPASIYSYKFKPKDKEEQEKISDFSDKVFAGSIILPIGLFVFILVFGLVYILIKKNI